MLCSTLRIIFRQLQRHSFQQFGTENGSQYIIVSAFLFLRFFCAAILTPKLFGLVHGTRLVPLRAGSKLATQTTRTTRRGGRSC